MYKIISKGSNLLFKNFSLFKKIRSSYFISSHATTLSIDIAQANSSLINPELKLGFKEIK